MAAGAEGSQGFAARWFGGIESRSSRSTIKARRVATRRAAQGFATRCTGRGISNRPVDIVTGRRTDPATLEVSVQPEPGLAHPHRTGLLCAAPQLPGTGAQRTGHQTLEARALASANKNAARQGRIIVFIDESGLSERPTRVKTWAPWGSRSVSPCWSSGMERRSILVLWCASIWKPSTERCRSRAIATLRPGAESGRVHLGTPEASRAAHLLYPKHDRLEDQHTQPPSLHAATSLAGACVLAAGRTGSILMRSGQNVASP